MTASLPRPLLLVLVGVVAIAGVFFLTRGKQNNASESAPAPAPAPAPQASAPPKAQKTTPAPAAKAPTVHKQKAPGTSGGAASPHRATSRTLPAPVAHALAAHKVVVLLFWKRHGVDDRDVKSAVDSLPRHGGNVAVFTDTPKHVARYARVTGPTDVVQTPTLLVVDRQGQTRKATGYLDSATVQQYVVDALHGAP